MKIAILGAGALGCYYGARLAEAGHDVSFIARSACEPMREHGLRVSSVDGDIYLPQPRVCRKPEECGPVDLVIVGWKTCANDRFGEALPPLLHGETEVVTFQNGMGNAEAIAETVAPQRVFVGLCFVCCMMDRPAEIRHLEGGKIHFAPLVADEAGRRRCVFFAELMKQAKVDAEAFGHTEEILWTKLSWNIPFNGLCLAHGGISVRQLFAMPGEPERAQRIMDEVCRTAELRGFPLPMHLIDEQMRRTAVMGDFIPSSAVDYLRGRPVEYQAIWGSPLERARAVKADIPEWEKLAAEIRTRLHLA